MIKNKITVGQVAQKFGVSARTIRHYEDIGLVASERDSVSNYRLYGEAECNRVYQILLLKSMGFTLKETSSIITSNGSKSTIIDIIRNKLKSLENKSKLYAECVALLNEFLLACSKQVDDHIDSFQLLSDLLADKNTTAVPEEFSQSGKSNYLKADKDLEVLKSCLSEDFNPLFLPFVVGQDDGDLLESFFVNHRRFWGLGHVFLTDGSNLEDIYNPASFADTIIKKISETAWCFLNNQPGDDISYKHIVIGLCNAIMGVEYERENSLPVLEMKLVGIVFARALEMLELAGRLNEQSIQLIANAIGVEEEYSTKQEINDFVNTITESGGIEAFYLTRLVNNAIKRNRYAGPLYVMTESTAFTSGNWELERALDMAVGFLWTHEIRPGGPPYHTLMPVIFQIAYMRMRMLYASASHTQPEIAFLDEFMVIGMELVTTDRDGESFEQIPRFETEEYLAKRMYEHTPNRVNPGIRYGLNCRRNGDYYSYITGEQVSSLENIPDGMTGELVPAGTYAVFTVRGGPLPYKVIETVTYAYRDWLPASMYQWVNRPGFNLYVNASGRMDSDIRIYVPVEKMEAQ